MRSALEQERDLILEQIQASREIYRQILATPTYVGRKRKVMPPDFPRSRTFRWVKDHPWITTSVFAALTWLGMNRLLRNRHTKQASKQISTASRPLKALFTIGALLLQNPTRVKMVGRLAGNLLEWIKR